MTGTNSQTGTGKSKKSSINIWKSYQNTTCI